MTLLFLDPKKEYSSQLYVFLCYFVVSNDTETRFLPLQFDFEEVTYQVTLYLCSSLFIQKRLSPIQTTNLNRTSLIRKDLKQVICSTTRVYNAVCNFAEPQFFLPIKKSSSAMFYCSSDQCIPTSEAVARRFTGTYFSLWCLFSIDSFFSFCTHLCTHISNINMHT